MQVKKLKQHFLKKIGKINMAKNLFKLMTACLFLSTSLVVGMEGDQANQYAADLEEVVNAKGQLKKVDTLKIYESLNEENIRKLFNDRLKGGSFELSDPSSLKEGEFEKKNLKEIKYSLQRIEALTQFRRWAAKEFAKKHLNRDLIFLWINNVGNRILFSPKALSVENKNFMKEKGDSLKEKTLEAYLQFIVDKAYFDKITGKDTDTKLQDNPIFKHYDITKRLVSLLEKQAQVKEKKEKDNLYELEKVELKNDYAKEKKYIDLFDHYNETFKDLVLIPDVSKAFAIHYARVMGYYELSKKLFEQAYEGPFLASYLSQQSSTVLKNLNKLILENKIDSDEYNLLKDIATALNKVSGNNVLIELLNELKSQEQIFQQNISQLKNDGTDEAKQIEILEEKEKKNNELKEKYKSIYALDNLILKFNTSKKENLEPLTSITSEQRGLMKIWDYKNGFPYSIDLAVVETLKKLNATEEVGSPAREEMKILYPREKDRTISSELWEMTKKYKFADVFKNLKIINEIFPEFKIKEFIEESILSKDDLLQSRLPYTIETLLDFTQADSILLEFSQAKEQFEKLKDLGRYNEEAIKKIFREAFRKTQGKIVKNFDINNWKLVVQEIGGAIKANVAELISNLIVSDLTSAILAEFNNREFFETTKKQVNGEALPLSSRVFEVMQTIHREIKQNENKGEKVAQDLAALTAMIDEYNKIKEEDWEKDTAYNSVKDKAYHLSKWAASYKQLFEKALENKKEGKEEE